MVKRNGVGNVLAKEKIHVHKLRRKFLSHLICSAQRSFAAISSTTGQLQSNVSVLRYW